MPRWLALAGWPADPRARTRVLVGVRRDRSGRGAVYPPSSDAFAIGNLAYFLVWVFMALGLSLIWGYGGMLSFGQTAFFGLAGYTYGVLSINLGDAGLWTLVRSAVVAGPAGVLRGRSRLLHVLRRSARCLRRHRHPLGHAGLRDLHGADRRAGVAHRLGPAERLQRHVGHAAAHLALAARTRSSSTAPRLLLARARAGRAGLSRLAHPGELSLRQRAGRDSRESRRAPRCSATTCGCTSSSPS